MRNIVKKVLTLALCSLPFVAHADLTTTNNTDEYSTAFITTTGMCSGEFVLENGSTPPHNTVNVSTLATDFLCGFQAPCFGVMVMAKTGLDATHCKGHVIAIAEMDDLKTGVISSVKILDPNYELLGVGTNHTTLNQISMKGTAS